MVRRLPRTRRGMGRRAQSAVFDAFLFFIILTAASVFTYLVPSTIASQNQELLASQYRDELVDDTLTAVLRSTIGSTSFVKNGEIHNLSDIDVISAVAILMELKHEMKSGAGCDPTDLVTDIESEFDIAVPGEYDYSVEATYSVGTSVTTETVAGGEPQKTSKSASTFEFQDGRCTLTITLFIWN